jgi:neutral ceramidase
MSNLQAGVSRVDITPPTGVSMCGYLARAGVSQGYERPLTATALVLTDGSEKVVIIACDLIFILNPDADEIRASIAAHLNTRIDCVLLNCSHTHCGPNLRDYSWEGDDQKQLQRGYLANLKNLLRGCAETADRRRQPARIGSGFGESWIGINRREVDDDGKVFLGENQGGAMDPTVGVVRIDDLSGKPLAVLFSYGCHTVTMGPKCLQFSPDFPGPARELIEGATGAKAMFLQAAAGNINPVTGIGATEDDTENMKRLGYSLGGEVLKTLAVIRTHQKRGERQIFASLTKNSVYPYLPVEDSIVKIGAIGERIAVPLLDPPSAADARGIVAMWEQRIANAKSDGLAPYQLNFYYRFRDWASLLLRTVEAGASAPLTTPVNVQAIRLGDLVLTSAEGETLVELGLAVRKASPFEKTVFLGYSNGCIGYIPPAECFPDEAWSPWEVYKIPDMLCQNYMQPMHVTPGAAKVVVDASLRMIHSLTD